MIRLKIKKLVATLFLLYFLDYFGVFDHILEVNYYSNFDYPLNGDITSFAEELKRTNKSSAPILNPHNYQFVLNPRNKCGSDDESIRVVYVVKSAIGNAKQREVIRKTWGYENRFSDVSIRTVFTLGLSVEDEDNFSAKEESIKYGDIVQGSFIDSYFNNTIKTMMSLKWTTLYCKKARFYLFVDDDYYVSTRNVLRFLRNPLNYPKYLEDELTVTLSFEDDTNKNGHGRNLKQLVEYDIPLDVKLFAGYVFPSSSPHRHRLSRWYISRKEYPYHLWPPYVTGGAIVLSREALADFYYGSYFVKPFRFDDIYLGILSKKLGIPPFHSNEFYFQRKYFGHPKDYSYVVASHGFSNSEDLYQFWNKQKEYGNA